MSLRLLLSGHGRQASFLALRSSNNLRNGRRTSFTRTVHESKSSSSNSFANSTSLKFTAASLLGSLCLGTYLLTNPTNTVHADSEPTSTLSTAERSPTPISALVRSYVVYSMCSVPWLVDYAPAILQWLGSVPGLKQVSEVVIRGTFFGQFVGGDSIPACFPLLERLRREKKGALFSYSVEVDASGASDSNSSHKQIVAELLDSIDRAADFEDRMALAAGTGTAGGKSVDSGRRTWIAVKMSGMVPDSQSLLHFSAYLTRSQTPLKPPVAFPGCPRASDMDIILSSKAKARDRSPMTEKDVRDVRELYEDLVRIGRKAQERGVKLIIDSEYSWYQPAVDSLSLALMRQFNRPQPVSSSFFSFSSPKPTTTLVEQPLIYGTFQAYLRRNPEYLAQSLKDAKTGGYGIGIKLVRGAYHPQETAAHPSTSSSSTPSSSSSSSPSTSASPSSSPSAKSLSISPDPLPPVWASKPETDKCFDDAARVLVSALREDIAQAPGAPRLAVMFATHNRESCEVVLERMVEEGLAVREAREGKEVFRVGDEVARRVTLGQLYGMNDELTDSLVDKIKSSSPMLVKYIPYGELSQVMPYLSRRAVENKSVLGGGQAAAERRRAWDEVYARVFGGR